MKKQCLVCGWSIILLCSGSLWLPQATAQVAGDAALHSLDGAEQDVIDELFRDRPSPADGQGAAEQGGVADLTNVLNAMMAVRRQIGQGQVGSQTQAEQEQIVKQLRDVIAELQSRAQSTDRSSAAPQTTSGRQSQAVGAVIPNGARRQPGTAADAGPFGSESLRLIWGKMRSQDRARISSPRREDFLPSYRDVITDYYRRLAEFDK